MFKFILTGVLAVCFAGCASIYEVAPRLNQVDDQIVQAGPQGLVSTKKHVVTVAPVRNRMSQFESPRFYVSIKNQSNEPIYFASRNIQARFNNEVGRVLSYEQQREAIANRLSFYGYRINFLHPQHVYPSYWKKAGFDASFDSVDIQIALADLSYLERTALRDRVLNPKDEYGGEVVIANKLSDSPTQFLELSVQVGGENHVFRFDYNLQP